MTTQVLILAQVYIVQDSKEVANPLISGLSLLS